MPVIEELPEDEDVAKTTTTAAEPAAKGRGGGAGMMRGFFNAPKQQRPKPAAEAASTVTAPVAAAVASGGGSSGSAVPIRPKNETLGGSTASSASASVVGKKHPTAGVSATATAENQPKPTLEELMKKTKGELRKMCRDKGISQDLLDDADDYPNPKKYLANLVFTGKGGHVESDSDDDEEGDLSEAYGLGEDEVAVEDLVEGLRRKFQAVVEDSSAQVDAVDEVSPAMGKAANELEEVLRSISSQARWPTSQVRSSRERAIAEVDGALADMRAEANDTRRLRAGDERRAASDLRRAAEDALERVRKVEEAAAPVKDPGGGKTGDPAKADEEEKERTQRAVAAFQSLPLVAKLRIVSDERIGFAFVAGCFFFGGVLMFGVLAELYTTWGCGFRCAA